ncbi:MAG TPA: hypothetical protein VNQ77_06945 [Frankiaceae bacterium]|nr:hypothetical protein [Frankiaceae bacterium]
MSFLRRALAGVSATTLLAGALIAGTVAPAAAEPSTFCPQATSTRLLTANEGDYKLWIFKNVTTYGDEYHICYGASNLGRGDIVIRAGVGGTLVPTVGWTLTDPNCPDFFTVQDPVELVTELGWGSLTSICFGVTDGSAVRLTVGLPDPRFSPRAELWVERYSYLGSTYCSLVNDTQCYYSNDVRVV